MPLNPTTPGRVPRVRRSPAAVREQRRTAAFLRRLVAPALAGTAFVLSCADGDHVPTEAAEAGDSGNAGAGGSNPSHSGAAGRDAGDSGSGGNGGAAAGAEAGAGGAEAPGSAGKTHAGAGAGGSGGDSAIETGGLGGAGGIADVCGAKRGVAADGSASRGSVSVENAGFELGLRGWHVSGDVSAVYVDSLNPHGGSRSLTIRSSDAYEASAEQTLCELPEDNFTLRAWLKSSTDIGEASFYFSSAAGEQRVRIPAGLSSALRFTIDIEAGAAASCPCRIGVRASGPAASWISLDDVELFAGAPSPDPEYLLGGDITFRRQLLDAGTQFYDSHGVEADVLDVLAEHGFNFARIRIYNRPGEPEHYPSKESAAGYQNAADALLSARAAADRGMSTVISFHFSDSWTNPGAQHKPFEWAALAPDELAQAVYDYTYATMAALAQQGTPPAIVALGNETNSGMIWPEGRITDQGGNFAGFAKLFNAGARAVKAIFPEAKVAIHLSKPEARPDRWIGWAAAAGLEYDTIGLSLYPFWSGLRVRDMKNIVLGLIEKTGKDVVALEAGFPWSLTRPSGYETLIASNGLSPQGSETFGVSPAGQELYLRSLFQQLHEVPGFLGVIYWDPIWIDTAALPSNVGDTALFDWEGRPLSALSAFQEKFW